jgi:hypothetical protein
VPLRNAPDVWGMQALRAVLVRRLYIARRCGVRCGVKCGLLRYPLAG